MYRKADVAPFMFSEEPMVGRGRGGMRLSRQEEKWRGTLGSFESIQGLWKTSDVSLEFETVLFSGSLQQFLD